MMLGDGAMSQDHRQLIPVSLIVLLVQVVYRLMYFAKSGALTKPLLARQLNRTIIGNDRGPEIPYWSLCRLKAIFIAQSLFGAGRFTGQVSRIYQRLEKCAKPRQIDRVETIEANAYGIDFLNQLVQRPRPVVVKGLALQTAAVSRWTFGDLVRRFGTDPVLLTEIATAVHREGRLNEIEQPGLYLANCEILFHRHPELREELDIGGLVGPSNPLMATSMQLFLGRGGTGTPYHCANIWNLFIMVSGSKRWTLVDPSTCTSCIRGSAPI